MIFFLNDKESFAKFLRKFFKPKDIIIVDDKNEETWKGYGFIYIKVERDEDLEKILRINE